MIQTNNYGNYNELKNYYAPVSLPKTASKEPQYVATEATMQLDTLTHLVKEVFNLPEGLRNILEEMAQTYPEVKDLNIRPVFWEFIAALSGTSKDAMCLTEESIDGFMDFYYTTGKETPEEYLQKIDESLLLKELMENLHEEYRYNPIYNLSSANSDKTLRWQLLA